MASTQDFIDAAGAGFDAVAEQRNTDVGLLTQKIDASDLKAEEALEAVADKIGTTTERTIKVSGPFELIRVGTPDDQEPPDGIYFGAGGNNLSHETLISSVTAGPDQDDQRSTLLIKSRTKDDGNSEEQTLCVLTLVETGESRDWLPSTAYALGDNITIAERNAVYRCTQAGTSAASGTGPVGVADAILDGDVIWKWINDSAINAKCGEYYEIVAKAGGGSTWGAARNLDMKVGFKADFAVNTELDLTNDTGYDSGFGFKNKYGLWIACQGGNRSTAGLQVSSANVDKHALIWGAYFAGDKLALNSVIGIDASSNVGIGFGAGAGGAVTPTFLTATIKDESVSPDFLLINGDHSNSGVSVLCDTNVSFASSGTQDLTAFLSAGSAPSALRAAGSYINAIRIVGSCSNAQILGTGFAVDPIGKLYATGLQTGINPPASSTATGMLGEIAFDDNYGYFCVAPNSWKRWALSAF